MTKQVDNGRRRFLKTGAAAGIASVALSSVALKNAQAKESGAQAVAAWTNGMQINPNIPNTRVVHITDESMITNQAPNFSVENVNKALDTDKVHECMDKMALALAQPASNLASDAWDMIFQKPEGKAWSEVQVGMTTNAANTQQCGRLAVYQKLAKELARLGVPGANMVLFDAGNVSGGFNDYNSTYAKQIMADVGADGFRFEREPGGRTNITFPVPDRGDETHWCVGDAANGVFDILINGPVCKGHAEVSFTMGMKLGYAIIRGGHPGWSNADRAKFQVGMHQTDAILGGTPPRMQLCIIDALWSKRNGPFDGGPTDVTSSLVMGTLTPLVDHWTAKNIREPLGYTTYADVLAEYLDKFGYTVNDIEPVDASTFNPVDARRKNERRMANAGNVKVAINGLASRRELSFIVPDMQGVPRVLVYNMQGRIISILKASRSGNNVTAQWDCTTEGGSRVRPGTYAVKVQQGRFLRAEKLVIHG